MSLDWCFARTERRFCGTANSTDRRRVNASAGLLIMGSFDRRTYRAALDLNLGVKVRRADAGPDLAPGSLTKRLCGVLVNTKAAYVD